jgi:YHS domain-containing protein
MRVVTVAAAAFLFAATAAVAGEDASAPEECLARGNGAPALTVMHGGKTYRMANEACRAQFLTDPERYAQLYDALLELEAEGTPLRAPALPSLVPS